MIGKDHLVAAIVAETGIAKSTVAAVIDTALDQITAALSAGEVVQIYGFGRFEAHVSAPHTGRNPRTGEALAVAASARARFHQGSDLRRRLAPLADSYRTTVAPPRD